MRNKLCRKQAVLADVFFRTREVSLGAMPKQKSRKSTQDAVCTIPLGA